MKNSGTFKNLRPLSLLRNLSSSADSTCLQVFSNSVTWSIYIEQGKITYATHTVEPFDRLERHLRRLANQVPLISNEVRANLRLMFESDSRIHFNSNQVNSFQIPYDYQAICWLLKQQYLKPVQAALLIQELIKEVLESFVLIQTGTYEFEYIANNMPKICRLDLEKLLTSCQDKLQAWKSTVPHISSPYQRPYLWLQAKGKLVTLPGVQPEVIDWMKGFSLRHLAVILNQDELQLAQSLYPYIKSGAILLHEPDPPFDKLPKIFDNLSETALYLTDLIDRHEIDTPRPPISVTSKETRSGSVVNSSVAVSERVQKSSQTQFDTRKPTSTAIASGTKVYKIVSVDDSPTILREISRFLEDENFSVITISDSLKAVMSIIRHNPDLILLDLNMGGIDGYELCRIIRNNSLFKNTPVIFVTSNKGLVDKVRARFVGASGYLTKPFTRAELLKMVFMHLT